VKIGKGNPSQEIKGDQKIGPGEDIELLWVGEAVSVAKGPPSRPVGSTFHGRDSSKRSFESAEGDSPACPPAAPFPFG
jgi:hypothetical protein